MITSERKPTTSVVGGISVSLFIKLLLIERKSNGITPNDVRALVNAPCQRLNAFAQAHRL